MINIPTNKFIEFTNSGRSLTKEFFCLSLRRKFEEIHLMEVEGLIPKDYKLLDKLILAVLQHSPKSVIKEFPVAKERKIRPEAREADASEYTQEQIEVLTGLEPFRKRPEGFITFEPGYPIIDPEVPTWDAYVAEPFIVVEPGAPIINPNHTPEKQLLQAKAIVGRPSMYFGADYEDNSEYLQAVRLIRESELTSPFRSDLE